MLCRCENMPTTLEEATLTVALIGNPNTGKSTLFGALVGIHQHVGNYPGVTVEKKTGRMEHEGRRFELVDLPGLYSLAARSRDEMVAVEVLLQRQSDIGAVDVVLCIVDGSNLERHLYLVSQVLELGLPTVVAVNMLDVAASRGIKLELRHLQNRLGIAVVPIQANRGQGLAELKAALIEAVRRGPRADASLFPEVFEKEVRGLQVLLATQGCHAATCGCGRSAARGAPHRTVDGPVPPSISEQPSRPLLPPALVRRLLLDASGYFQNTLLPNADEQFLGPLRAARQRVEAGGCPIPAVETTVRYAWARSMLQGVVSEPKIFRRHGHRPHRSRAHASCLGADRLCGGDAHGFPVGLRLGATADGRDRRGLRLAGRFGRSASCPKAHCGACWPWA